MLVLYISYYSIAWASISYLANRKFAGRYFNISNTVLGPQPAAQQPLQWMPPPGGAPPGCPPGLEYLTMVDQLIVKQQIELLEGKSLLRL